MPYNPVVIHLKKIGLSFWVLLVWFSSCSDTEDGTTATSVDQQLQLVSDSVMVRGYPTAHELQLLERVKPGTSGVDRHQLALKHTIVASFPMPDEKKIAHADTALMLLEKAFTTSEKSALLFANAAALKSTLYLNAKKYNEFIRSITLQKLALQHVKDSCAHTSYHQNMAKMLFLQKRFTAAIPHFKKVVALTEKCRPKQAYAIIQENIDNVGLCYYKADMPDSALHYYNAALAFINNPREVNAALPGVKARIPLMKAVVLVNMADQYINQQKYQAAETLLLQSICVTEKQEKEFTTAARFSLLRIYLKTAQPGKAAEMVNTLQLTVDTTQVQAATAGFYNLRAEYYSSRGQAELAYKNMKAYHAMRDAIEKRDRQFNIIDIAREFENQEHRKLNELLQKANELKQAYLLFFIICTLLASTIAVLIWYSLKRKSQYVDRLQKLNEEVELKNNDLYEVLGLLERTYVENKRLMLAMVQDLRNPVGGARMLAYSLLRGNPPEHMKEALELIQTTCSDTLTFLKKLLDNKQNDVGAQRSLIDMARLVEQCSRILQLKAAEKNQQIHLQTNPVQIRANREELYRVISHLINNAIKFSPANSSIEVVLHVNETTVLMLVKDQGIGIAEALQDKILEMSLEASPAGTGDQMSQGLGLSICTQIVHEHSGKLWFESEAGKGTVFYVELPLAS